MPSDHRADLKSIRRFDQLIRYLRDEMGWPIESDDFEELIYEYTPEELGIDAASAAKIQEIKRLRPLSQNQPWGIFFVKFEPKRLPVVALRRILSSVVMKKRSSANKSERAVWAADDLLFVSNYGEGDVRQISFAHFSQDESKDDLPTLKVLGWDNLDTPLHLDHVAEILTERLTWPNDETDVARWRESWGSAFTLRHREVITTSKVLAVRLAELARAIRDRIRTVLSIETKNGPVTKLMKAFQEALIHDLDAGGFADMYAQTITYGLLSARITNPKANTADGFAAQLPVTNPFLKELMETFLHVGGRKMKAGRGSGIDFDELGVSDVVDLLDDANMEAVVRDFGDRNPQEDPVIHFYELFLAEYDKKTKVKRGVFYTPQPVVSYIVRSVHELLQTEFGLTDGLADTTTWGEMAKRNPAIKIPEGLSREEPFVQILDIATGTATFLVEVIDIIHKTMMARWEKEGHLELEFDQLWNEYVPKHLLPRLYGFELMMAPYAIAHMKIGLKLYETGYRFGSDERVHVYLTNALEPPQNFSDRLAFDVPALAHEASAVNAVKRYKRFTVVIGNPPYSHRANMLQPEQRAMIEPYKFIDGQRMKVRGALQLERNLNDDYVKFIRFAQVLVESSLKGIVGLITNNAFIENLTFPGMRNSLVKSFNYIRIIDLHGSTKTGGKTPDDEKDENVFDIQQGVAISFLSATPSHVTNRTHCNLWGSRLLKERLLSSRSALMFHPFDPVPSIYLFIPEAENDHPEYHNWAPLDSIFHAFGTGIMTNRNGLTIAMTRAELVETLRYFVDQKNSDQVVSERVGAKSNALWDLKTARREIKKLDVTKFFYPIDFRPFDTQVIFYHEAAVDNMRRAVMSAACKKCNITLLTSRQQFQSGFQHVLVTRRRFDECVLSTASREKASGFSMLAGDTEHGSLGLIAYDSNISTDFLASIIGGDTDSSTHSKFFYIYSILHSPTYRLRYANHLKRGYPQIPPTNHKQLAKDLSRLGGELVALHLMESPKLDKHITRWIGGKNPELEKVTYSDETVWTDKAQTEGFRSVPEAVWNFHIGGYQVCQKWLKDHKGRTLSKDDIVHYQKIVVALAETIRIMREIDEVINEHGGWPDAFSIGQTTNQ